MFDRQHKFWGRLESDHTMSTTWKMPQAPPPVPSPVASRRRQYVEVQQAQVQTLTWRRYQAGGISLALHCSLFLIIGILGITQGGTGDGPQLVTSVILQVQESGDSNQGFFVENVGASSLGGEESGGGQANVQSSLGSELTSAGAAGLPGSDQPPVDVQSGLAAPLGDAGGGLGDVGQAAGGLGLGAGGSKLGGAGGLPLGRTSLFGIEGNGSRFVYVFDRSSSMNGFAGLPMANAKSELIKSLESLERSHQFQLVFYNETPMAYGQLAGTMAMLAATDENKHNAIGYVRRMKPDGGTEHLTALRMALGMSPDVIFFLTDADEPGVTGRELDDLIDRASRHATVIHTIQFGTGGNQNSGSWIAQLARQTRGKYRYIDVTTFTPAS